MKSNFNSSREQILISFSKKICFYSKSFVFDTHFFVFVIRIKLFLMSLLTMAFKKSFLYKTYSLWTFSKILFFYLQGTKKCCSLCGTLTVPSDLRRVFLWFFKSWEQLMIWFFLRVGNSWRSAPTTQRLSVIRVEKKLKKRTILNYTSVFWVPKKPSRNTQKTRKEKIIWFWKKKILVLICCYITISEQMYDLGCTY